MHSLLAGSEQSALHLNFSDKFSNSLCIFFVKLFVQYVLYFFCINQVFDDFCILFFHLILLRCILVIVLYFCFAKPIKKLFFAEPAVKSDLYLNQSQNTFCQINFVLLFSSDEFFPNHDLHRCANSHLNILYALVIREWLTPAVGQ